VISQVERRLILEKSLDLSNMKYEQDSINKEFLLSPLKILGMILVVFLRGKLVIENAEVAENQAHSTACCRRNVCFGGDVPARRSKRCRV